MLGSVTVELELKGWLAQKIGLARLYCRLALDGVTILRCGLLGFVQRPSIARDALEILLC